ncbi:hypothetical protein [Spirosoma utsteinense]|uniref:hypothetical protein n=1 Tax=Spirosoma utsteinense TaxID=2585773 RepID=UPI00164888E3|nr:hypothetical protein [Spirosoma utsteinense]MBC3786540.1 hypothetical protein [Spirosoma utsteinense]
MSSFVAGIDVTAPYTHLTFGMFSHKSFLFNPTQSGIFYFLLFGGLIWLGLSLYEAVNGHYSIIGSVASFLAFFVAFQSWKAADDGSRKADEAIRQIENIAQETHRLAQSNFEIDQQIKKAVVTISDSTRELFRGYGQILAELQQFLEEATNSECLYIISDTAAVGKFPAHYDPNLHSSAPELGALADRLHETLLERVRDSREFYIATLSDDETTTDGQHANSLYQHYLLPIWQTLHNEPLPEGHWLEHLALHQRTIRQIQDAFAFYEGHREQREMGLEPCHKLTTLPFQAYIRVDLEHPEPFKALIIFVGQYNMNRIQDARAMMTADPELVRTFISMFESLTQLDNDPRYQQLRKKLPL